VSETDPPPEPGQNSPAATAPAFTDARRLELVAAVDEVADGTQLLGQTVQRLLSLIVPGFADVATLDAVGPTGEMRRLGARVVGERSAELEQALLVRHQTGARVGVMRTLSTGESQLVAPVTDEWLRTLTKGERDYELLSALQLHATIYAPLRARGRILGALACSVRGASRTFTQEDLRFAESLANRIGLALDNAGLSETVSGLERRLEETLANLATGVIVRGSGGEMVFANARAAELLGMGSVEELFSASPQELMDMFIVSDESGRPVGYEQLPSTRAMRGEPTAPLTVRSVRRSGGDVRWIRHNAIPVRDPRGDLSIVVNAFEDITQAKRAELSQRLLSTAGRELASSLDYEGTLQRVAQMAVPELADWCGVSLVGSGPYLEQVAVAHVDADKVALARGWGERNPTRLDQPTGAAEVIRSGKPQLIPEISQEMLAASGASELQLEIVREIGMRSVIIVPLALPGSEPFGTLSLVMAESGRLFDEEDLAVAEELGRRGALAVQNARLYTDRTRIATALQQSLRQPLLPDVPGYSLASTYRPAGDASEVGGDFYDAVRTPQGWLVVIGDVTGHGAEAAALASLARHTLRTAGRLLPDPVGVIEQLDVALREHSDTALVTVCCVLLREDEQERACAEVLLAGHPQPYHLREGRAAPVGFPAQILGAGLAGSWRAERVPLAPGDQLVLFTDGVVDTLGEAERFGFARLEAVMASAGDAQDTIGRLEAALGAFAHGRQSDDTAAVAIERLPDAGQAL
jgi:PAS domain S-box-containing protein